MRSFFLFRHIEIDENALDAIILRKRCDKLVQHLSTE